MRRIWRAAVEAVTPYEAGKPLEMLVAELGLAELVRLSANENPLGASPRAVEAVRREAPNIHLYPDGGSAALRDALAHGLGISPEQIVVGNGADEEDRRHDTAAAARERALLGDETTEIGDALGDAHRVRGYCIVSI